MFLLSMVATSAMLSGQGYTRPATSTSVLSRPILHIVEGPIFEFGIRPPGSHRDTFHLTNIGNDTLIIHYLKSSCGCLVGELEKHRLSPGDTSRVFVHFIGSRSGTRRKTFRLLSNDPTNPVITIRVQMTTANDLEVHPFPNYIILNGNNGIGTGTIRLRNVHDSTIFITDVRTGQDNGNMDVTHNFTGKIRLEPGAEYEMIIKTTLHNEADKPNMYGKDRLVLHTTGPYHPELKLSLFYRESMSSHEE